MDRSRRHVVLKSIALGVSILALGTTGYMAIEDQDFLDALYMTSITVTTVGFREAFPLSPLGEAFTMVLAFGGIGVILVIASEFAHVVIQTDIRRLIGMRRDFTMIKKLSDHILVCGHGRMGQAVVEVLRERGVRFVVVEADPERCHELEEMRIQFVQGDATQEEVLSAAGAERARTLIACLADDAHNVYLILLARQLNPDLTVIARAMEQDAGERMRLAGANRVINPYHLGGTRLALTAIKPTVTDFIEASVFGSTVELELAEVVVHPSSDLAGKTLAGAEVRQRFGIIVVALKRGEDSTFNPGPNELIEAGDVLVALGPLHALERIERATQ